MKLKKWLSILVVSNMLIGIEAFFSLAEVADAKNYNSQFKVKCDKNNRHCKIDYNAESLLVVAETKEELKALSTVPGKSDSVQGKQIPISPLNGKSIFFCIRSAYGTSL